jgi:hypothetical protein
MFVARATDGLFAPGVSDGTWCLFRLSAGYAASRIPNHPSDRGKALKANGRDQMIPKMVADPVDSKRHAAIEFLVALS